MRRQQGYSVPMTVEEARILYRVITDTLHANLLDMDVSSIIPDLYQISDSLNVMLAESLRSFLAGEQIAALNATLPCSAQEVCSMKTGAWAKSCQTFCRGL